MKKSMFCALLLVFSGCESDPDSDGQGVDAGLTQAADAALDQGADPGPACKASGTCVLPCGDDTCDGLTEACFIYSAGYDVGNLPDGGRAQSSFPACEPLPDGCSASTCACITGASSEEYAECTDSAEGARVFPISA